jgi:hypothetical protein
MKKYITTLFLCFAMGLIFGQKTPPKDMESVKKVEFAKQLMNVEDLSLIHI